MNPANPVKNAPPNDLGVLLRHWRDLRAVSQLDLSFRAGVSQRHISFIESGRSVPSRQMLLDIAQTLDIPLRERNTLLLAAGYAPIYADTAWNAQEMQSVTNALGRMLRQHEPFPALVMDRYWNVLMTNDAAPRFFNCFIDMAARAGPRNMLHLIFDPQGLRPFVADWQTVADSLIQRVRREAVGRVIDDRTRQLLDELLAYPAEAAQAGVERRAPSIADASAAMPVIPIGFVKNGHVMKYFSMVASVGTPQTVAAQELRLECMFPADEETEARHLEMLAAAPQPEC
ncbi:helix-turn-helix domain-containing protein [Paraburkholderia xenovorans]|uniref:helix-turn-helix domain-containing protein n=1 Tax=Paraburkholderia xenovorans TaxID=36873 RepID=UPI0015590617|nr:helix-turn-helix transcriptional regulator [Paraburkholderia xenovorans]NPT37089.1 helix-turn-helix domain-containing protein [Paraburkholderia xenovorans]